MGCPRCQQNTATASMTPGAGVARCEGCGFRFEPAASAMPRIGSAVLGPQSASLDAPIAPKHYVELPLVDHDHPLRRLKAAWRAARDGTGQMVSLVGEVGSGRSRLIRELGRTIDEDAPDALWMVGQAHSYATYSAYGLLAELLAPLAGDTTRGGAPAALAAAFTALGADAPELYAGAFAAAAEGIGAARNIGTVPADELAELLAEALPRLAAGRPLVVVLEDLEWADAASLAALDALLPRLLAGPALVLCTHHADWSHDWPEVARHYHLILGPLSHEEGRRLVDLARGEVAFPEALVEALVARAGGSPLQLEQATYALREQLPGLDEDEDPLDLIPETLQEAILARVGALPAPARDALVAAAVLGQSFAYDAVAAVSGEMPGLDDGLRELARRRLVVRWRDRPQAAYRFAHGFIQEVAYGSLHRGERQVLEARVADWLLRESAQQGVPSERVIDELAAFAPPMSSATAETVVDSPRAPALPRESVTEIASAVPQAPTTDTVTAIWPMAMQQGRRNAVLARIALGDLTPDRRASVVLCLQHGYTYRDAGELLGLPTDEVQAHLYEARVIFKRLYEASEASAERARDGMR